MIKNGSIGSATSNANVSMSFEHTCTAKCIVRDRTSPFFHAMSFSARSRRVTYSLVLVRTAYPRDRGPQVARTAAVHWHRKQAGKSHSESLKVTYLVAFLVAKLVVGAKPETTPTLRARAASVRRGAISNKKM